MLVNRDALLNEIRMVMTRYSHGEAPSEDTIRGMAAVASIMHGGWERQTMLDLIGAMLWCAEQADQQELDRG